MRKTCLPKSLVWGTEKDFVTKHCELEVSVAYHGHLVPGVTEHLWVPHHTAFQRLCRSWTLLKVLVQSVAHRGSLMQAVLQAEALGLGGGSDWMNCGCMHRGGHRVQKPNHCMCSGAHFKEWVTGWSESACLPPMKLLQLPP